MSRYILNLIAQGEHQQLDFKFAINDSKKIARTLAAFANTDGGRLLIGVKDNGAIAGVNSDEEYYMVEAGARLHCKPEVKFEVSKWTVDDKTVLEIIVAKSNKRPHTAPGKENKPIVYVRVKDENIIAHPILAKAWVKQRRSKGISICCTERHNYVIQLLTEHGKQTFVKLCKLAFMSEREMEKILIDLLALNLLAVENAEPDSFFEANIQ
ncbi:MAG: ATP-binding protein [Prevotellaceae bacterium]|jgi:predicted HTH transcriptional regulator|nr:ATP-binding protein [Prevotellaceae bacterium]